MNESITCKGDKLLGSLRPLRQGKVLLVGAGPGDCGLLTLRAKEALKKADVIVYDHLINSCLLSLAKKGAELIYVGKEAGKHTLRQEEINKLLVQKAKEGLLVVRLKGGDPFVFGRGGEELEEVASLDIPFEVIPGISSAIAVPGYAGIPLTHRDFASSVAFVTGHEREEKVQSSIRWEHLAKGVDTIVFLMGIGNAEFIAQSLISYGRRPDTPVAIIERGTTPKQRTLLTTLQDLKKDIQAHNVKPPGVIVVGEVVSLSKRLNWFERLPLFSKRIIVTRPKHQAGEMVEALKALGAEVVEFPTIEIAPPDSLDGLQRAIASIEEFSWLIFTSANGVEAFFQVLFGAGKDTRSLKGIQIACIGPKTGQELKKFGIIADMVPKDFKAEGLVEEFSKHDLKGLKVLIPRAQEAREVLVKALEEMGAEVKLAPAYKTRMPTELNLEATRTIFESPPDLITFTSSSTVINFRKILEMAQVNWDVITQNSVAACIGPITGATAKKAGFKGLIEAKAYTTESLLEEIFDFFQEALP